MYSFKPLEFSEIILLREQFKKDVCIALFSTSPLPTPSSHLKTKCKRTIKESLKIPNGNKSSNLALNEV